LPGAASPPRRRPRPDTTPSGGHGDGGSSPKRRYRSGPLPPQRHPIPIQLLARQAAAAQGIDPAPRVRRVRARRAMSQGIDPTPRVGIGRIRDAVPQRIHPASLLQEAGEETSEAVEESGRPVRRRSRPPPDRRGGRLDDSWTKDHDENGEQAKATHGPAPFGQRLDGLHWPRGRGSR